MRDHKQKNCIFNKKTAGVLSRVLVDDERRFSGEKRRRGLPNFVPQWRTSKKNTPFLEKDVNEEKLEAEEEEEEEEEDDDDEDGEWMKKTKKRVPRWKIMGWSRVLEIHGRRR